MKATLVLAFVALSIAVASAALSCIGDAGKCGEDECCVKIGPMGKCKKRQSGDQRCEMRPSRMLTKKHVYKVMCPCASGLSCVAKDGLVGKVLGTCQGNSGEQPEPDEY